MLAIRAAVVSLLASALLQGCAATSPSVPAASATTGAQTSQAETPPAPPPGQAAAAVPELKLNLPQQNSCDCPSVPAADYTFLEKGYHSLLDGEYEDAMDYFLRYQRLESSPRANLEVGIAIAYVQMLPRSNYYNPRVARSTFKVLRKQNAKKLQVHDYTRLMRQSLLNMLELQEETSELKASNTLLQEDLKKREEALKRLRDLTLNQNPKAATQ